LLLAAVVVIVLIAAFCAALTQPFVAPLRSEPAPVDPDRLKSHVRALSEDHAPRSVGYPDNLDAAGDYILTQLRAAGVRPTVQPVDALGLRTRNVIARFGPDEGPLLVIGAHYDTCGELNPGADDNASGVAVLIELAGLLAKHRPARPVELVAYTLEEPPFFRSESMGSAVHAASLAADGRRVELMISLEMLGYFSDEPGSQGYPIPGLKLLYPDRANFIAVVGRFAEWRAVRRVKAAMRGAAPLDVRSINIGAWVPGVDFSDHLSYWKHGFPALMISDTAFFRYPHYHGAGDTYDRLDYARMADVARGVFAITQLPAAP
jgi:Zn-dependent M28 family amino/carboxypeptidase